MGTLAAVVVPPSLRRRPFRLLWIGLIISINGSQMQQWALYWHIRQLTDQPIAVSVLGLVRFVPIVILSLFAGVIADRFNRQKLVIVTQVALGLVALTLGLMTYFNVISLRAIYILSIVQSVAITFDLPARQAIIPNLVTPEELPNAYSMNSISHKVGAIVGSGISGMVIAYLGLQWVYWFNAVSYLVVVSAVVIMGTISMKVIKKPLRFDLIRVDIREGLRFMHFNPKG
ncbi:MAG: hypothetical protein C0391_00100 [Anaerolinea sp.]|nr:hypothetical protein [Anaerolinea sp.]